MKLTNALKFKKFMFAAIYGSVNLFPRKMEFNPRDKFTPG